MRVAIVGVVLMLGTVAAASPMDATVVPAPIVLPSLKVTGNSDGSSSIDAGLTIKWGMGSAANWDVTIEPSARTTATNGVANLFSSGSGAVGASKPWGLALQATLSRLADVQADANLQRHYDDAMHELKQKVVAECRAKCAEADSTSAACVIWKRVGTSARFESLESDDRRALLAACDTAGEVVALNAEAVRVSNKAERDLRAQLPGLDLSAAFAVGTQDFSYLSSSTQDTTLTATTKTLTNVQAAVLLSWLSKRGVSLELPVEFHSTYGASTASAQWCTPVGMVPRAGSPGVSDPAQSCSQSAVGAPSHNLSVSTWLLAGWTDWRRQLWRGSGGLTFRWTANTPTGDQARVGLVFPLYLSFAKVQRDNSAVYHGLVRVMPALYWTHDSQGWSSTALLSLELLGERTLFGARAKEWF